MKSKIWKFGNDINTDLIIPSQYCAMEDFNDMAKHTLEGVLSDFASNVKNGDIIVGGKNFGCGSSREQAPKVLKILGISAIFAEDFARIFFRNSINLALPVITCQKFVKDAENGDNVSFSLSEGKVINETQKKEYTFDAYPKFMQDIIDEGGLSGYLDRI